MSNQLETYLADVKAQLKPLPADRQNEEIEEIRQHLQVLIAGSIERGDSEDEAVTAAIAQFGAAKQVGRDLQETILAAPISKRVLGLGLSGGLTAALAGAMLHGIANAILAARADWQNFSFIVSSGFVVGAFFSLLCGTIAFALAGALIPQPKSSSVFRTLCPQAFLGMAAGSLLGLISGTLLGAILRATQSSSNGAPVGRDMMRYFDSVEFFLYAYYGALLLMLIGLIWGVARGAIQARKPLTAG